MANNPTMSLFRTRRSVKTADMDINRAVPRALLTELLEDAHRAPTHGLTQPWRFHVFTGDSRARLGDGLQDLFDRLTPPGAHNADKRAKLAATPRLAPVAVAVACRLEPGGKIPEIEEIAATSCAVQNLLLSAHAHGLGAYWSTPPVACTPEFAVWLGLDAACRGLGVVYLGYPRGNPTTAQSPRNPLDAHVVFLDR